MKLAEVSEACRFGVLEHLETSAEVPVLGGLQAQGDLFIVPRTVGEHDGWFSEHAQPVGAAGVAVIEATGQGGHEHRLFAGSAGTALWAPDQRDGQAIGVLDCTEAAYVLHPEHGATGIAPGRYELRRQREQADEERLVAD